MRSFLIAVVLGLTGLTFYSALAYKSKFIEDDITKRVTDDLTASNAQGVGIDVDGRHVTLSGIVYDEAQETAYLKTANDTYGALGPIDGLTYQTDGGYVSAQKTDAGIALRGSVPNEAARASLLEAAAAATDGEVDDQLVISGPEADWQGETQFGMQQLAALSTGAMTASAAGYVLSGTTDGNVAAVADPVSEREGWSAFVSSPVVATGLQGQVADLKGQIDAVTQERDALDGRLAALKDGMTDELVTGESLRADLLATRADLDTANVTIAERDETIAAFNSEKSTLVSRTLDTDTKLADTEQKLSGAKATIVALTAATAVKDGTIKDLNGRVSDLETDLASRQQALGSTDEQVAALRADVAERDAGLGEADAKIVALNNELGGQDDTIDVLEAQVAEKDATLGTANETISALSADLGARDETIAGLEAQATKLDAEVYTLGATVAARDTTIANLKGRLTDTSSNLQSDNERIAVLAATVQERDASLADSAANVALLTSQAGEKDSDIGALSGQVDVLQGRVATLTDQTGAKDAEIGTLTGRIGELEGMVATRDAALGDADAKVAALMDTTAAKDTDVDTLTGKVGELTAVVAARDATIASLRAQGGSGNVAEQCATQASNVMEGARINFGSGNARITPESTILLERLTGIALACVGDDLTVEIGGHTDSQGSDTANKALSERRAQAVQAFMTERGVPNAGVRAVGFGEGSPVADNATAAGRAANRRITFEWQAR